MTRKRLLGLLLVAALLAGAGVALLLIRQSQTRAAALAGVPDRPSLDAWPSALAGEIGAQEAAIRAGHDPREALARLAGLYHANGFYAEAQHAYATLQQLEPAEPRWHHLAAHIHAVFGELDRAIPLWEHSATLAPDYLPVHLRLGEARLKTGQLEEATQAYTAALRIERDNPYAQLGLARVDIARDDWAAARTKLEKLSVQTERLIGADLLASAYERTGEPRRGAALRALQKSHGLYVGPGDPWIDELMALCFDPFRLALESGTANIRKETENSQRWLNRALQLAPDNASLHFQAGTLAEQRGQPAAARTHLEKAVQLNQQATDAWAALVRVLAAAGDTNGSWRALSEALSRNPDSPILLLERGRRFKAQGRTDAAISDLRRVTQLRRDEALAFIELASIYFTQERVADGIAVLEQGLEAEPGHPVALSILAFASIQYDTRAAADRWLREVYDQPRITPSELQRLERAYLDKFGQPPPPRPR